MAAASVLAAVPAPTQYVIDFWSPGSGLPEETISSVTQTSDGYLWLAATNRLIQFDGAVFRVFDPRKESGESAKHEILSVGPGPEGSVWLYSKGRGVFRFDRGLFRPISKHPAPCSVQQISRDDDQTLVICVERILRFSRQGATELARSEAGEFVSAARDQKGQLWVGCSNGRVLQFHPGGGIVASYGREEGIPEGSVYAVQPDNGPRVWIATNSGLGSIENGKTSLFTTRDGLTTNQLRRLKLARDGTLWVGTTSGIELYRNGRFENFKAVSELPGETVREIYEDRESNIWAAFTETSGLFRIKKPKFLSWGMREGLLSKMPRAVIGDGDTVWIACPPGLQFLRDGVLQEVKLGPPLLVRSIEIDKAGRLWALAKDRLFIVDRRTAQARPIALPGNIGVMRTLNLDREGRIWLVAEDGLYVAEGVELRKARVEGLPKLPFFCVVRQSRDGRYWVAAAKQGLFEIKDGKALKVKLGNDAELENIHTFYIDRDNDFWLGLDGGGLVRWRNGAVTRYGQTPGEPANFVYQFGEDTQGYFWAGLRTGLLRVRKSQLNDYLDRKVGAEPERTIYNVGDGLASYNFGMASRNVPYPDAARVLWFVHMKGIVKVDSEDIPLNTIPPPIHLVQVLENGADLPFRDSVTVPAGTAMLGFVFSAPSLVDRGNMQMRYRLAPFDVSWRTSRESSITYSRVPAGTYTFMVSASNNDDVWNEGGISIPVVVLPRYYETWWFRVLVLGALAGCALLMYRWRTMLLRHENERLEQRVAERTEELAGAKQAAEKAARVKADFLATMSHEIRTPMHGVLGNVELLAGTTLDSEQREYLEIVRNSSNSLMILLNDILDLTKLEAGRMNLRSEPFSLKRTIDETVRLLQAPANLKKLSISFDYADALPERFRGDEARIRQILSNLAGNAVKFTQAGEVVIAADGCPEFDGIWKLKIDVRDTGIGIPQNRIRDLFQKFSQVVSSPGCQQGTGLGLAISRRLAQAMNGTVEVQSEEGKGSTFSLIVSLPQSDSAVPVQHVSARRRFSGHVLVAEDNLVNQKLATRLLERLGCTVTIAGDGRDALDKAEKRHYPIVFMDCNMPEMDGFEAARQMRSRLNPTTAIIAMTANALPGDRERCMEAGMNDYISKPFQVADLTRVLDLYLSSPDLTAAGDVQQLL